MTRTYTRFFSEDNDSIEALRAAVREIELDWHERREYVSDLSAMSAGDRRVALLRTAVALLTERTPE